MFGKSGDIYTVHEKADAAEPSDRIVLLREGFSLWAFVLTLLWLLYHRCWRWSVYYLGLMILLEIAARRFGVGEITMAILQLGLQCWLGIAANDIRRAALQRAGYREIDIVCAESQLLAERRYFDRQPVHAA